MAGLDLPFPRGTTLDSGSFGAVPTKYLGSRYNLQDGTELQVVKNTDGNALNGAWLVEWEDASAYEVQAVSNAGVTILAGITDPELANQGNTVPVNALCYIVKRGNTHCIAGAVTTVNTRFQSDTGSGRLQDITSAAIRAGAPDVGVTLASANDGASVEVQVYFG